MSIATVPSSSNYMPGDTEESSSDKKEDDINFSCYDGLVTKTNVDTMVETLKNVTNKEDYFIFFEGNEMYPLVEVLIKMGFTQGLLPTSLYNRLEKDRDLGKKIVQKFYKDVIVAEKFIFSKVDEGIKKVQEGNDVFVLKGNGDFGDTIVPRTDNPEIAKKLLTNMLDRYKADYEKQGFVLEKKILGGLEVSPTIVFWNGKPVYSVAEFESKEIGAGNIGVMKGGNLVVSVRTDLNCKLNQIAFPEVIYKLAERQPGFAIYDAGLLYKDDKFYFLEYCGMRPGYDSIYAQIAMSQDRKLSLNDYFTDIMKGKSPIKNKYGVAIRLFNIEGDREKTHDAKSDRVLLWDESVNDNLFLYRIKKLESDIVVVGGFDFFGVMTAAGDTMEKAVDDVYKRIAMLSFERLYYRPKFDFLSTEYPNSIPNRLKAVEKYL
ncbi:MAG: hypothetical protein HQK96_14045 [Nitrospirae bacterium]|nr:hypothetical protein [Nitrospirota bacterium]